jgi:hypothetical protein
MEHFSLYALQYTTTMVDYAVSIYYFPDALVMSIEVTRHDSALTGSSIIESVQANELQLRYYSYLWFGSVLFYELG